MKNRILVLITCVAIVSITVTRAEESKPSSPAISQEYTCLMHPKVVTAHPGTCPKCGMTLVRVKAKAPLSSHKHTNHDMDEDSPNDMRHGTSGMQTPTHQMGIQSSISIADPMSR